MTAQGSFTIKVYCKCGASMIGSGAGDLDAVDELRDAFWQVHTGEGHGPATQREAANARRRYMRHSDDINTEAVNQ